jgi:hypothetical protein
MDQVCTVRFCLLLAGTAGTAQGPPPSSVPARLLSRKGSARLSSSSTSLPGTPIHEAEGQAGSELLTQDGASPSDQQQPFPGDNPSVSRQEPIALGQPSPSVVEERWGRAEDLTESIKRRNPAWPALGAQQGGEGVQGTQQDQQVHQVQQVQEVHQPQAPLTGLAALLARQKQEQQGQQQQEGGPATGTPPGGSTAAGTGEPVQPQTPLGAAVHDPRAAPSQLPTAFGSLATADSSGAATNITVAPLQGWDSQQQEGDAGPGDHQHTVAGASSLQRQSIAGAGEAGSGHSLTARKSVSIKSRSRAGPGHLIEGGGSSGAPHSPHHTAGGGNDDSGLGELTQRSKSRSNMLRPVNVAPNPALAATRAGSRAPSRMGSFTANPAARQAILQQLGRADPAPHSPKAAGGPPSAAVVRWKLAGVAAGMSEDQPGSPSSHQQYAQEQHQEPSAVATVKPKVRWG